MWIQKRPPCVDSKRPHVYRHHAHMLKHMCAWCRHKRGRLECTHGGVFESTHGFFTFFQRAATHTHKHTHTRTNTPPPPTPRPQRLLSVSLCCNCQRCVFDWNVRGVGGCTDLKSKASPLSRETTAHCHVAQRPSTDYSTKHTSTKRTQSKLRQLKRLGTCF